MALKNTCNELKTLLEAISADLEKASEGNQAAAQRVRTHSIKFQKVAKHYRKESVQAAKTGEMAKVKKSAKKSKSPKKKAVAKKMPKKAGKKAAKKVASKKSKKAAPRREARKAVAKKRTTAKLPAKRARKG